MIPAEVTDASPANISNSCGVNEVMYKVCIKAAGRGTRISYAQSTNKALLPVGGKSALFHIIDKFSPEVEIVVAVGHHAQLVKDFVSLSHGDRKIVFVDVDRYEGEGSGPGYSLLCCKPHLQCPFIFFACDTLVLEDIPEPNENWIGVSPVSDSRSYLVAEVYENRVTRFYDKLDFAQIRQLSPNPEAVLNHGFIGLAAVKDYETFWEGLEETQTLIRGECQVSHGLNALIPKGIPIVPFTWFDLGDDKGYERANWYFTKGQVLLKPDEFTYFEGDKVIKFFAAKERVQGRAHRAKLLEGMTPELLGVTDHFFAYRYINGQILSDVIEKSTFSRFLQFMHTNLWKRKHLTPQEQAQFIVACKRFYLDKTRERVNRFFQKTGISDKTDIINETQVPTLDSMLERLDWNWLSAGEPVLLHGDPQPENVITSENGRFYLLDWREDFGGIQEYGDIYYDLAKIYHALIISGEIVRKNDFMLTSDSNSVSYNFYLKNNLVEFKSVLEEFIVNEGYDLQKVKVLSALIYLNIAPLHHEPYDHLLYYLGKHTLYQCLEEL